MAAAGGKEQDAQGVQQEAAAAILGLEDGEHVAAGDESDIDMKLDVSGNVEAGKEDGLVTATAATTTTAAPAAVVTDIEKKRRRAERFGTDLKITEADKRKLRAARFNDGTKNGAVATDANVKTDVKTDVKVPDSSKTTTSAATDSTKSALLAAENAKRKARAERFGSIPQELAVKPKNEVSAKSKLSQDEESKKKARMARFAMAAK